MVGAGGAREEVEDCGEGGCGGFAAGDAGGVSETGDGKRQTENGNGRGEENEADVLLT